MSVFRKILRTFYINDSYFLFLFTDIFKVILDVQQKNFKVTVKKNSENLLSISEWKKCPIKHFLTLLTTSIFHHIETVQLICRTNQFTGLLWWETLVVNGLKLPKIFTLIKWFELNQSVKANQKFLGDSLNPCW